MNRRNLVLGAACVAAAGAAYALEPRRTLNLLGDRKIEVLIPGAFGAWVSQSDPNLVQPDLKGSLAAKLYSQTATRIYFDDANEKAVMMLVAYGGMQSDLLQLHRPEACYPAVGYRIEKTEAATIALRPNALLPVRHVIAERGGQRENIVYWARLGEYLPVDSGDQRRARLLTAMSGYVADGGLFRFSSINEDSAQAFRELDSFVAQLANAVPANSRSALIGTKLARAMSG